MIITNTLKKEIEELIPEHEEALVAYGADMYRRGMFMGAFCIALGFGLNFAIHQTVEICKKHRNKNED